MNKIDPIVILLFLGMILFTVGLVIIRMFDHQDGQLFQAISHIDSGFVGAFFMRITPKEKEYDSLPKA